MIYCRKSWHQTLYRSDTMWFARTPYSPVKSHYCERQHHQFRKAPFSANLNLRATIRLHVPPGFSNPDNWKDGVLEGKEISYCLLIGILLWIYPVRGGWWNTGLKGESYISFQLKHRVIRALVSQCCQVKICKVKWKQQFSQTSVLT